MSSSVENLLAQLGAIRGELPYARSAEFDAALEAVCAQVQVLLRTSRHIGLVDQIHAARTAGSAAIQQGLQHLDELIAATATQF